LALSRLPICLIPSLLPQHARPTCQCCVNWSEVRTAVNDDSELVSSHLERSLAIFDVSSLAFKTVPIIPVALLRTPPVIPFRPAGTGVDARGALEQQRGAAADVLIEGRDGFEPMVMPKRGLDFERLVLTGFRALVLRRRSGTVRDETEGSNPVFLQQRGSNKPGVSG
jgi:hypothetical protein